jgi:hypothetical protein
MDKDRSKHDTGNPRDEKSSWDVLAVAGTDSDNKATVGRAQAFLLKTQLADGSWWVISMEKGRKGLASSHYGSGWATLGLIRTSANTVLQPPE